ncbi:MAG: formylglycine-generating enzyme family protein, partial [Desulfobacteraceae bacterium]|nr:formylglycine-generating enzyme family protein [Desulfobacteraceae bacterium]
VMGNNPSYFQSGDDYPVENVSWNGVQEFIKKLNEKEGAAYRLPTEAEWEYSCKAGTETAYYFGNDSGQLGEYAAGELASLGISYFGNDSGQLWEYAWYSKNSDSKTHSVAQKKPNAWGLYDMHGNVWEWCQDSCDWKSGGVVTDTYKNGVTDPVNESGSYRVVRGGSGGNDAGDCRSAYRGDYSPDDRYNSLGFRLSRGLHL